MVTPVFVAGLGRSGTTAMMSLLATDSRVAVDRVYPFENRYFTYLAKIALLIDGHSRSPRSEINLDDFGDSVFGSPPWDFRPAFAADNPRLLGFPSRREILSNLWGLFNAKAAEAAPDAEFYAEKAPSWVPSMARESFHAFTIFLFRDLRDVLFQPMRSCA